MKRSFLAVTFCCGIMAVFAATGNLMGKIVDTYTGVPVADCEIVITSRMDRITVETDHKGRFYAYKMQSGRCNAEVTYNGRKFVFMDIPVYADRTFAIDFHVSSRASLPELVEVKFKEDPLLNPAEPNVNRSYTSTPSDMAINLTDLLDLNTGYDYSGRTPNFKGSKSLGVFIDGTPMMGTPTRHW